MATTKPRITITLTDRQHEVLKSISDSSGQSMSSVVSEVLEPSMPVLERMAATFQHLKRAKDADKARVVRAMEDAQDVFEPLANQASDQLDLFLKSLEASYPINAEPIAVKAAPGRPKTPPTNRGVTPHLSKAPKPLQGKGGRGFSRPPVSKNSRTSKGGAKP